MTTNKKDQLVGHVMALFQTHEGRTMGPDHLGDRTLLKQWIRRCLAHLPDDAELIDKAFEPLYELANMPRPSALLKILWLNKNPNADARSDFENPPQKSTLSDLARSARNSYSKGVCRLIFEQFGFPARGDHGELMVVRKSARRPLPEYYAELKRISEENTVHCPPAEIMLNQR